MHDWWQVRVCTGNRCMPRRVGQEFSVVSVGFTGRAGHRLCSLRGCREGNFCSHCWLVGQTPPYLEWRFSRALHGPLQPRQGARNQRQPACNQRATSVRLRTTSAQHAAGVQPGLSGAGCDGIDGAVSSAWAISSLGDQLTRRVDPPAPYDGNDLDLSLGIFIWCSVLGVRTGRRMIIVGQ